MVVLTEQLVKSKTRLERLDEVRNLNLWGQDLSDLSILEFLPNVEILSLSVNKISTLKYFEYCKKLQELYLRKNEIANLSDVQYLSNLKELKVLWLNDNPCANTPNYRLMVIQALPNLVKLDNMDVSMSERDKARDCPALSSLPDLQNHVQATAHARPCSAQAGHREGLKSEREMISRANSVNSTTSTTNAAPLQLQSKVERAASAKADSPVSPAPRLAPPNILYAVMALISELDDESLRLVRREIDQRLQHR